MKKIMFNDKYGLTAAVLDGRKTMTRRMFDYEECQKQWNEMCRLGTPCYDSFEDYLIKRVAKYKIGERIAIAQAYKDICENPYFLNQCAANGDWMEAMKAKEGWNNKMYVSSYYMPWGIEIVGNKAERMQDISDEDCLKEGIFIDERRKIIDDNIYAYDVYGKHTCRWWFPNPRLAFATLIDKVSGKKGTWESNPWVFAYEFKLATITMEEVQQENKKLSQAIQWIKGLSGGTKVTRSDLQLEFKIGYQVAERIFDSLIRLGYLDTVVKGGLTVKDVDDFIRINEVFSCEIGHPVQKQRV